MGGVSSGSFLTVNSFVITPLKCVAMRPVWKNVQHFVAFILVARVAAPRALAPLRVLCVLALVSVASSSREDPWLLLKGAIRQGCN